MTEEEATDDLICASATIYSLDTDPQGIRARVVNAVLGALTFGARNENKPPEGHWLGEIWDIARPKNPEQEIEMHAAYCPALSGEGCDCGFKKAVSVDWDGVQDVLDGVWRREMSADDGFDQLNELISTTTPQSKPLMAEQINSIWKEYREILGGWDYGGTEVITESLFENSVRAIEAAHGIGGEG